MNPSSNAEADNASIKIGCAMATMTVPMALTKAAARARKTSTSAQTEPASRDNSSAIATKIVPMAVTSGTAIKPGKTFGRTICLVFHTLGARLINNQQPPL